VQAFRRLGSRRPKHRDLEHGIQQGFGVTIPEYVTFTDYDWAARA
jgi:hypothetical protein